jgi:hypothetical protein
MLAIGMPRFAREDGPHDEDDLNREHGSSRNTQNFIAIIFNRLANGDERTAHSVMQLAEALKRMAQAGLSGREDALESYGNHASDLINFLESDDDEEND